jgi:PHP family Zn ribbon phosphoesterase
MPEYVVTIAKRISCTAEVTVRAKDEDAAWEKVEDAFGEELEELVEAAGGWRDAEAEYEIEEVGEA